MTEGLGVLSEGGFYRGEDRDQFEQAGNLHDGIALWRESGERHRFSTIAPTDEQGNQRANSGGIQKRQAAHIQYQTLGRLRAQSVNKIVHRFQAQLSLQPSDHGVAVGIRLLFYFESRRLHKLWRLAQKAKPEHQNFVIEGQSVRATE
jgi:hypothetical protein